MSEEQVFTQCTVGGPVRVYVEDGVIKRMRPIIFDEDDAPSWTIEARGRKFTPPRKTTLQSYEVPERTRVYTNRIQYPLKRKNFDPSGERHPELRGKDEYERISWDEALDLVAGEITRIRETHGPAAITAMTPSHQNWGFLHYKLGPLGRFFNILGYSQCLDNPDSWEGWHWGATHAWGYWWRLGHCEQSELLQDALKHTEQVIFWSVDPNSTSYMYSGQENLIWRLWMKELGIQFVVIDPHDNCTASTMGDKWIAPRPGTDAALAQAIGYVWLTEDTYDHFFVENRTYGFDEWKKYILGEGEDGTPKTPEWAAAICDVPAHTIKALAREWAAKKTMLAVASIFGATGACRQAYATEWTRLCIYLMSMQGFGKPGVNFWGGTGKGAPLDMGFHMFGYSDNGWDAFGTVAEKAYFPEGNTVTQKTYRHLLPDIVMEPPVSWIGEGFCGQSIEQQFRPFTCPEEGPDGAPIKMIHRQGGSFISTMSETNKWVRMYQHPNLEFVVMQDCHWSSETKFGDVILPVSTNFEHSDLSEWGAAGGYGFNDFNSNHRICIYQHKCIEPLWESKPDYEIYTLLAAPAGLRAGVHRGQQHRGLEPHRLRQVRPAQVRHLRGVQGEGLLRGAGQAGRRGARRLLPLVLRGHGRRRALGEEEPARPAGQRPQPGHAERQGGVRLPDPDGVRPGRRGAAAHGPVHPELGGLRHRGPRREVAAADDLAAPAVLVPHAQRQQEPLAGRHPAAPGQDRRLRLLAGAHQPGRMRRLAASRTATW